MIAVQNSTSLPHPPGTVILGGAHGSLALARALGKAGVRVFYVSNDSPLPGWSRHTHGTYGWPGPDHPGAVAFLQDFARSHGMEGALLVAGSDAEVKFVSQSLAPLSGTFRILLPEWEQLRWLCDKPLLYRRAAELGIAHARTWEIASVEEAQAVQPVFPVVLKPHMGGGAGSFVKAKVTRADDRGTFLNVFTRAAAEIGARNIVVQQFIPGGGEGQFSYAALWSGGKPVAEFTARRARQYPVDFGFTSTCVETVDMPDIVEASRALLASVNYCGLVEIEFKRDPRDGSLNILDANPRPWSWFALSAACGLDLARMMWDVAGDRPVPAPAPAKTGTAWMYLARDAVAATILMARGRLNLNDYLRSFSRVRAWAAFSGDDLKPGLLDLPLTAWRVLTRRVFNLSPHGTAPFRLPLQPIANALRYNVIRAGLEVTAQPLVQRLFPNASGRGVIFTLHHVLPSDRTMFHENALLAVTPEFLEAAIKASLERGLTPVHLHDLPTLLADPAETRNFVAFTLDDGYRNNAEFAAPIFRRFNIPYTIFINPGFVRRTRTIWWETAAALVVRADAFEFDFGNGPENVRTTTETEMRAAFDRLAAFVRAIDEDEAVRRIDETAGAYGLSPAAIADDLIMTETELRALGVDPLVHFGAHTVNHVNLRRVDDERLRVEVEESIATIETWLGRRPRSFSYPYGWSSATGKREAEAIMRAGVALGVTTQPGVLTAARLENPGAFPRVSLNGYYQKKRYVSALLSGIPFILAGK